MKVDVETRYKSRIVAVMISMTILWFPFAMLWQHLNGNGGVRVITNTIGLRNVFDIGVCGFLITVIGLFLGFRALNISLQDVTLDKGK